MKKFLLMCAAVISSANLLWAYDSTIATPVKALTNGGHYYIYDAHGDNGRVAEAEPSNSCRYAFRYDSGNGIRGTHIKPRTVVTSANDSLQNKHVWRAVKDGDNWKFQNVATQKWIGSDGTASDQGTPVKLESTRDPRVFTVVIPGTGSRWDGNPYGNHDFVYWNGSGHPIQFFEANSNGSNYYLPGHNAWSVYFSSTLGDSYVKHVPDGADVNDHLPVVDFVTFTLTGNNSSIVGEKNKAFSLKPNEKYPFRASTDARNLSWQAWFMHTAYNGKEVRYALKYTPGDDAANVTAYQGESTSAHPDEELWAFEGNYATGFKIYNKKAGTAVRLTKGDETATLENPSGKSPETMLWWPVASNSDSDQGKFFTFRAYAQQDQPYTYLNLQWKETAEGEPTVGMLKFWEEADQGSTAWVEGMSQPIIDTFEIFSAPRPTITGVVGDFTNDQVAAQAQATAQSAQKLVEQLDPWYTIPSSEIQKINELKRQLEGYPRIPFSHEYTYRLCNCQYGNYMQLNDEETLAGQGSDNTNSTIVTFSPASAGKYYMAIDNKYFANVNQSENVTTTDNVSSAAEFELSTVTYPFQYVFKGGEGQYGYLHEDQQHSVVGWNSSERPSMWYLLPAKGTGRLDEMTDEAPASSQAAYDLQGRRVSNPTSGLYIINRRKVFIK